MTNLVTLRPKPGDVVEGVYQVECELGSDASCAVLGAVVPATGKRYALRCWLDSSGADAAIATQQFVRIANSIRLFEQPGIVEVFGVGRTNGLFFSVTEWLEGTPLERYLLRSGPLSSREALELLLPCLEGLAAAHSGGITHGDIRPANVFVCRATRTEVARARLGKFDCGSWPDKEPGIQRQINNDIYHRQFVSPEELQGAIPDPRSDVYSVGVLLYVMLAGQSPFAVHTARELDRDILTSNWAPLSQVVPRLAPGLDAVIARAMTLDPDERFRNMSAMLAALARVEGDAHSELAKHAPVTPTYKWITQASQWIDSPLFDLSPDVFEQVEQRRRAGSGRTLRACLVLALCLLSATMLHRLFIQPDVPLLSARERQLMLRPMDVDDATSALSFEPLPVPVQSPTPAAAKDSNAQPTSGRSHIGTAPARPAAAETPRKPASEAPRVPAAASETPSSPSRVPRATSVSGVTSPSQSPLSNRPADALERMQLQLQ